MKKYWIMGDIHGDYLPVKNFYIKHKNELSKDPRDNILILKIVLKNYLLLIFV